MHRSTVFQDTIFFKPVIFGVYLIFFFARLNYISKPYVFVGEYEPVPLTDIKKDTDKGVKKDYKSKHSPKPSKLNKSYIPQNLYGVSFIQLPAPLVFQVASKKVIAAAAEYSVIIFELQFERGPPLGYTI